MLTTLRELEQFVPGHKGYGKYARPEPVNIQLAPGPIKWVSQSRKSSTLGTPVGTLLAVRPCGVSFGWEWTSASPWR
jgi:hypothetical protein